MNELQDGQNKLQTVQYKLADLEDEFTTERITHEEFKRLTREWFELIRDIGCSYKDTPISLLDYIRVRYGKF